MADPQNAYDTLTSRSGGTQASGTASQNGTLSKARSKRASQPSGPSLSIASSSSSKQNGGAGPSTAVFPITDNTTLAAPQRVPRTPRTASEPGLRSVSEKSGLETPVNNKGKRKAEEVDITPPDQRAQHATFIIPTEGRREYRCRHLFSSPHRLC